MDVSFDEKRLNKGGFDSRRLKAKLFEIEMDRLSSEMKSAKSESDLAGKQKLKSYIIEKYNKYNGKNVRS